MAGQAWGLARLASLSLRVGEGDVNGALGWRVASAVLLE